MARAAAAVSAVAREFEDAFAADARPSRVVNVGEGARTRPRGGSGTQVAGGIPDDMDQNAELRGDNWYGSPQRLGIAQKMVRDAHVRRSLEYIRAPIIAARWDFQAPEKTPLALEIADWCRYNFFERINWRRCVRDGFLYLRDGFSIVEFVEDVAPIPSSRFKQHPGGGVGVVLRSAHHRPAWSIVRWHQQANAPDQLASVEQYVQSGDVELGGYRPIESSAFLRWSWEQEGAYFPGLAPLRSAYGPWKTKLVYLVVEAIHHERQGAGVPAMSLPADAGDTEVDAAEQILAEMRSHHKGYVLEPDGFKFRWENGGETTNIGEAIERCNRDIAYNVGFGHMLLGLTGGRGSFALASTQDGQAQIGIEDHAAFWTSTFNHGSDGWSPVRRAVELNYGAGAPVPMLVARNLPIRDWSKYLSLLPSLVSAKLLTPDQTLEGYLREAITLPGEDPATAREYSSALIELPQRQPQNEDADTASWREAA